MESGLTDRWIELDRILSEIPELLVTGGAIISLTGKGPIFKPGGDVDAVAPFKARRRIDKRIRGLGFICIRVYWTLTGHVRIYKKRGIFLEVLFSPWYDRAVKLSRGRIVPKEWRYTYFNLLADRGKWDYYLKSDLFDMNLLEKLVRESPFREILGWNAKKRGIPLDILMKHYNPLPIALIKVLTRVLLKSPYLALMWILRVPLELHHKLVKMR